MNILLGNARPDAQRRVWFTAGLPVAPRGEGRGDHQERHVDRQEDRILPVVPSCHRGLQGPRDALDGMPCTIWTSRRERLTRQSCSFAQRHLPGKRPFRKESRCASSTIPYCPWADRIWRVRR
jgi:hypothetical protein